MKTLISTTLAAAFMVSMATPAISAEPIVGTWKRNNGTLIEFANAGGSKYCGTVLTGTYKGQSIGCLSGTGGNYKGKINVLDEGKTYKGKATAVGANTLKLEGCVLFGALCKGESMKRQ